VLVWALTGLGAVAAMAWRSCSQTAHADSPPTELHEGPSGINTIMPE
jgi:hypothetical protein